jgi:hypothetical protein
VRYSNVDLHCHSNVSDGSLSPSDVVTRAHQHGVETLSLTDHDTIAGLNEAKNKADELGMKLIPGIELSCQWRNYGVHILAYDFAIDDETMQQAQRIQTENRLQRAREIAAKLVHKGLPDVYDRAVSLSASGVPGRPHFAQALIDEQVVESHGAAFKQYLGSGKVGDVKNVWPSLAEVMDWISSARGVAVIAHPRKYNFSLSKLRLLIEDFKALEGRGMEVIVSGQKPGEVGMLADLCGRNDLLASVGSDFHSPKFAWAEIGRVPALPSSVTPVWTLFR